MSSSHSPGGLVVSFDDEHAVANAGLLLTATLAERLEIEAASTSWSIWASGPARTGLDARS
jgi:hypothetical protein